MELKNICKKFGEKEILKDFSMVFPHQGIIALLGPSGSGKTTLLQIISGLLPADSGQIIHHEDLLVSVQFQEDRLFPWMTAFENVSTVLSCSDSSPYPSPALLFEELGIKDAKDQYPKELSGGMQRRVSLARALAFPSYILLLDEPLKGLDPLLKETVIPVIKKYTKNRLVIFITHDLDEAKALSSSILLLEGPPLRTKAYDG